VKTAEVPAKAAEVPARAPGMLDKASALPGTGSEVPDGGAGMPARSFASRNTGRRKVATFAVFREPARNGPVPGRSC
jgi:hypothetical protein